MVASYHGRSESFASLHFRRLVERLAALREAKGLRFKVVVGGSGALEFVLQPQRLAELPVDHVVHGEMENSTATLFRDLEEGNDLPRIVDVKEYNRRHGLRAFPQVEEIPAIVGPAIHDLVEAMRGCGRNCSFCEPNLRAARYYPLERVEEELRLNVRHGGYRAWLQSEDVFLYRLEDHRDFYPNREAVLELFRRAMAVQGVERASATHGTIAPAAADPGLFRELTEVVRGARRTGRRSRRASRRAPRASSPSGCPSRASPSPRRSGPTSWSTAPAPSTRTTGTPCTR